MAVTLKKYSKSVEDSYYFSILIPTWNNLDFLKNCLESIKEHSKVSIQIIVFINEGKDGTLEWLENSKEPNIDFIYANKNMGICYGMNLSRSMMKSKYLIYLNDDMYVLPGWDTAIKEEIEKQDTIFFMFSSTVIEPVVAYNAGSIKKNYGQNLEEFNKSKLLSEYKSLKFDDWSGSMWPPSVTHVDLWDLVGGLSVEFSPGMYSDPDFCYKLYQVGVREFKGLGNSLVYHFGRKSTKRIRKNPGRRMFIQKWGMSAGTFTYHFLKLSKPYKGKLPDYELKGIPLIMNKIKRVFHSW